MREETEARGGEGACHKDRAETGTQWPLATLQMDAGMFWRPEILMDGGEEGPGWDGDQPPGHPAGPGAVSSLSGPEPSRGQNCISTKNRQEGLGWPCHPRAHTMGTGSERCRPRAGFGAGRSERHREPPWAWAFHLVTCNASHSPARPACCPTSRRETGPERAVLCLEPHSERRRWV